MEQLTAPSDGPRLRFDVFIHRLCAHYKLFLRLRSSVQDNTFTKLLITVETAIHIYVQKSHRLIDELKNNLLTASTVRDVKKLSIQIHVVHSI